MQIMVIYCIPKLLKYERKFLNKFYVVIFCFVTLNLQLKIANFAKTSLQIQSQRLGCQEG